STKPSQPICSAPWGLEDTEFRGTPLASGSSLSHPASNPAIPRLPSVDGTALRPCRPEARKPTDQTVSKPTSRASVPCLNRVSATDSPAIHVNPPVVPPSYLRSSSVLRP